MSRTQVKLLQNVVSVSPGLNLTSELTVEKDINAFLASNEGKIRLIDIKLSSNAASVGERISYFALSALLIYEEL
ncbi:MAG TPA: hypothetical protein VN689_13815 [Burkholderiales bacterium]|jgi:hypothetical protein|nr:hypothetical protein [Burkholderiales bacterium]